MAKKQGCLSHIKIIEMHPKTCIISINFRPPNSQQQTKSRHRKLNMNHLESIKKCLITHKKLQNFYARLTRISNDIVSKIFFSPPDFKDLLQNLAKVYIFRKKISNFAEENFRR